MKLLQKVVVLSIITIILTCLTSIVTTYSADEGIIEISTAEQMWQLAEDVNNGQTYLNKTIVLKNDIDLGCSEQKLWTPIGTISNKFKGTFDGQNFSIRNMKIGKNANDKQNIGLFGTVSGKIERVNIIDSSINNISLDTTLNIGMLVGYLDIDKSNSVESCKVINSSINIETDSVVIVGGMIGYINNSNIESQGIISNCSSDVKINIKNKGDSYSIGCIGGIIGISYKSTIINCINNSNITINVHNNTYNGYVGGILGKGESKTIICYCYNIGDISVKPNMTIENGVQYGNSIYEGLRELNLAGGIIGNLNSDKGTSIIDSCFNKGTINSPGQVGGIAGGILKSNTYWSNGKIDYGETYIKNCYNLGEVKANYPYSYAGGICGANGDLDGIQRDKNRDGSGGSIDNCYNAGNISCSNKKGGIVGLNNVGGEISSTYYLSGISGYGTNNGSSCSTIAKKSTDMKTQEFVNLLNKDGEIFSYNQYIINNGYPLIKNIIMSGLYQSDGYWFLFENNTLQYGWQNFNGNWFYFARENEIKKNSTEYYPEGAMVTDWQCLKGLDNNMYWFYFAKSDNDIKNEGAEKYYPEGAMAIGWQNINYNGTNYWFYLSRRNNDVESYVKGAMVTGRQYIDNEYYYFAQSPNEFEGYVEGAMVTSKTIGDYTYDSEGICQTVDTTSPTITTSDITYGDILTIRLQDDSNIVAWQISKSEQIPELGWTIITPTKDITVTKKGLETGLYYIYVKDLAGNISSNSVMISPISLEVEVIYSTQQITNENITVTITANEKVQGLTGWTLSTDSKTLTKEYSANKTETITIKDLAGNSTNATIEIKNIDKEKPVITGVENGKVYKESVTATATDANPGTLLLEKAGTKVEGYTNGKEIIEEGTYKLTATDKVGNTTIINFTIKYTRGELNGNNQIDIGDVLLLLRHIAQTNSQKTQQKHPEWKLSEKRAIIGDINKNGTIDIGDVLKVRRYMAAKASKSVSDKHPDWLNIE